MLFGSPPPLLVAKLSAAMPGKMSSPSSCERVRRGGRDLLVLLSAALVLKETAELPSPSFC